LPRDSKANRQSTQALHHNARTVPPRLPPVRVRSSVRHRLPQLQHRRSTAPFQYGCGRRSTTPLGDRTAVPPPCSAKRSLRSHSAGCEPTRGATAPPSVRPADPPARQPEQAPLAAAVPPPPARAPVRKRGAAPAVRRRVSPGAGRTFFAIGWVQASRVAVEAAPRSPTRPAGAAKG